MVLLLRQSGEIIRGRKSPTRERDDQFTQAKNLRFADLERDYRSLRTVPASGLSLPPSSSKSRFSFACSRSESGFHGQTSSNFDHPGPPAGWAAALSDQRLGGTRPARGPGAVQIPWLNPEASENCVAKSTICLIVMCSRRCLKFIVGWYPSRSPGEASGRLS